MSQFEPDCARPVSTAVILAAGMGTRLRGVSGHAPKGLLAVGDEPILIQSVRKLRQAGMQRICVVVGFEAGAIRNGLADHDVEFVDNPVFASTGSLHSLVLAAPRVESDCLVVESDLVYEARALAVVQRVAHSNVVLVSDPTGSGDEVFVTDRDGVVAGIAKRGLPEEAVVGELVGISRVSRELLVAMQEYHASHGAISRTCHYEEGLAELAGAHDLRWLKIPDLCWTEIDTPEDYERAVQSIYPTVVMRDEAHRATEHPS